LLQLVFLASLFGVGLLVLARLLLHFRDLIERRSAHVVG
jgi:hypothetical protein